MKELVMTISIQNNFFAISYDDENNTLTAIGLGINQHFYPIVSDEDVKLINTIIDSNIRKVYFELDKVDFEGEEYIRFQNRYNSKYYFALAKNREKILDYADNKNLYDYYNPKKIIYIYGRNDKNPYYRKPEGRRPGQPYNNYDGFSIDTPSFNGGFGSDPYGYTPGYYIPKRGNTGKKIAIAIGGIVGAAVITVSGLKHLTSFDFPPLIGNHHTVLQEGEKNEYGLYDYDVKLPKEETLTDDQLRLKNKYNLLKEELEAQGFKPWEIAIILSSVKQSDYVQDYLKDPNAEHDNISFYYDQDTDSVVYIYGNLDGPNIQNLKEKNTSEVYDYELLSEDVKKLVDTLNNNPNISQKQKDDIINKFAMIWQDNIDYYQKEDGFYYNQLISTLENLTIDVRPVEEGRNIGGTGNPHVGAAGYFDPYTKEIVLFGESSGALHHEVGHGSGDFGIGNTLLTEGYNEWKNGNNSVYENERYMAYAFEEVFGEETLKEAFTRHNLCDVLTDKLVEEAGIERDEAEVTIRELLCNTQSALYNLGYSYDLDKDIALEDEDINRRFSDIMNSLEDINSRLKNPQNNKLLAIKDYFTNNRSSDLLQSEGEKILSFEYLENGSMLIEIGSRKEFSIRNGAETTANESISRFKIINGEIDKEDLRKVHNYELNYVTPYTFNQNEEKKGTENSIESEEGKDGVEDCMEDERMKPSIIDRVKRFFDRDKDNKNEAEK